MLQINGQVSVHFNEVTQPLAISFKAEYSQVISS